MAGGIYQIVNTSNNKRYIGSSANIKNRWMKHKSTLSSNRHENSKLQRAWNKYGEAVFKFEVLQYVDNSSHLLAYEQVFLDYFKSYEKEAGYNICPIAGRSTGTKHTDESKQKMSIAAKNRTKEQRYDLGAATKGKPPHNKGKSMSEDQKQKISATKKGKSLSDQHRAKLKGRPSHNKGKKKQGSSYV